MKKILALALTAVMALSMASCSDNNEEETTTGQASETTQATTVETQAPEETEVSVAALKGPTGMGLVKLMDDSDNGISDGNKYDFEILSAPDEMTTKIVKGEVDIAAIPANLASVLYNKTEGNIEVIAVNTLGVLYIVENGETINSVENLKGKTIYASGKEKTPEFALNFMLLENGIDPENDVDIQYKQEHAECVTALGTNENAIAMLPQPFVTIAQTKNENIRIAIDMTKEWDKSQEGKENPSTMITGVMVAQKGFIEENPEALNTYLDSYKKSVDFVNDDIEEGARLVGKYNIVPEGVALKAIPYCNITFIEGNEMKTKLSGYLNVLFEQKKEAVGGQLPDDNFYYTREEN